MNDWSEEDLSKRNRRRKLESEKDTQVVNLPILNVERKTPRKVRDKKINLLVKKIRKKS